MLKLLSTLIHQCNIDNVESSLYLAKLELTTIIEHDVKKLDRTWFESPFADDIEATVIIT